MSAWSECSKKTYNKVKIHELINFDKSAPYKVSILVPVCNVEKYLRECLDSLINQTLREIEIICINDGSTDSSLTILKEYAQQDSRVKIIDKENAGYGHAMNIGTDLASGEYIGIVESDDYVELDMYEALYDVAVKNDLDVVKSNFNRFKGDKSNREFFFNRVAAKSSNYNVIIDPSKRLDVFNFVMNTWTGIYRRKWIIENVIRYNESPGASFQDNGFYFQTLIYTHRLMFIDKAFYNNRRDNENSSVMSNKKINCMQEEYDYIDSILKRTPTLYSTYISTCIHKRFVNYLFTYDRIALDDKLEYIKRVSIEYNKYNDENLLDKSLFTQTEIEKLNFILTNPEGFHKTIYGDQMKISIIIPTYNEETYVKECLDSISSQKLTGVEVIVVDDGSSDKTLEIITNYKINGDKTLVLLKQEHKGSGPARNYGISVAKGKYVAFMDADDLYPDPSVLYDLYVAAESHNAVICGGSFSRLDHGKIITDFGAEYSGYSFKKSGFINYSDYQFDYGYHRFIYRKTLLDEAKITFPAYWRYQDPVFMVNIFNIAKKFYAIPRITYRYRKIPEKVKWNKEKLLDLMKGILDNITISNTCRMAKLHYNTVMRVNHDYVTIILDEIANGDIDVLQYLLKIQSAIDVQLLNQYKKVAEPFIVKPLYRMMVGYQKISNYKDISTIIEINDTVKRIEKDIKVVNSKAIDDTKKKRWTWKK